VFRDCSGLFRGVPGVFRGVPGVFRGVPGCSGVFRECSGFYRHPFCFIAHVFIFRVSHSFFHWTLLSLSSAVFRVRRQCFCCLLIPGLLFSQAILWGVLRAEWWPSVWVLNYCFIHTCLAPFKLGHPALALTNVSPRHQTSLTAEGVITTYLMFKGGDP